MNRTLILAWSTLLSVLPSLAFAGDLTPAERAFFDQHLADLIRLDAQRLDTPEVVRVFSAPVYAVKVVRLEADGEQSSDLVVARMGQKLVAVSRPGTDADMPELQKMLNPAFRLRTDADAAVLQQALDAMYPIVSDSDAKLKGFHRAGNQWKFVRGDFFEDKLGFLFETDAGGAITSAKFQLRLP